MKHAPNSAFADPAEPAAIDRFNELAKAQAKRDPSFKYFDMDASVLDANGKVQGDLFQDGEHFNDKGYALINPVMQKFLISLGVGSAAVSVTGLHRQPPNGSLCSRSNALAQLQENHMKRAAPPSRNRFPRDLAPLSWTLEFYAVRPRDVTPACEPKRRRTSVARDYRHRRPPRCASDPRVSQRPPLWPSQRRDARTSAVGSASSRRCCLCSATYAQSGLAHPLRSTRTVIITGTGSAGDAGTRGPAQLRTEHVSGSSPGGASVQGDDPVDAPPIRGNLRRAARTEIRMSPTHSWKTTTPRAWSRAD